MPSKLGNMTKSAAIKYRYKCIVYKGSIQKECMLPIQIRLH